MAEKPDLTILKSSVAGLRQIERQRTQRGASHRSQRGFPRQRKVRQK